MKINNKKIFDTINSFTKPFKINDIFNKIDLTNNEKIQKDIEMFFETTDQFVLDNDIIYPKASFLKNINLQIIPTEFEIKNEILILGHRIIPFQTTGFNIDDVKFFYEDKKIKIIEKQIDSNEMTLYFSLLDIQSMPIKNFHDIYFNNVDIGEINVFDMKSFYKKNNFTIGDSILIKNRDYKKCEFNIEYYSKNKMQENFFFANKINKEFIDSLKKVLTLKLKNTTIEKQLLYSFYYIKDLDFSVPVTSLGPLLNENKEIIIGVLNNGNKILFLKGQNINDFQNYPDFNELEESINDLELDIDSIDGILSYYGNTNSETIVRALIFTQLAFENYDYQKIIDYLFQGHSKPYLPVDIENILNKHIENIYKEILIFSKKNPPILPVNITRKNILDVLLKISLFLRELDKKNIQTIEILKQDFFHLSEICANLEDMLYYLEDSFNASKSNFEEIEQFNETINLFEKNLPIIFNEIKDKINSR